MVQRSASELESAGREHGVTSGSPLLPKPRGDAAASFRFGSAGPSAAVPPSVWRAPHAISPHRGFREQLAGLHQWFSRVVWGCGDPRDLRGDPPATAVCRMVSRCHSPFTRSFPPECPGDGFQRPRPLRPRWGHRSVRGFPISQLQVRIVSVGGCERHKQRLWDLQ